MANQTTPAIQVKDSNVGIGTASPQGKLEVFSSSDNQLRIDASGTYSAMYLTQNQTPKAGVWMNNGSLGMFVGTTVSNGYLTFGTDNSSEKMRITSAGNVGIGTTSPAYKLQVAGGDIAIDYNRYLRGGGGGDWNLVNLYNGGTGDLEITMLNANWYLRHNANATFAGNVGIGTTSPNYKLDVNGSINIYTGNSLRWGSGDVEILNSGYSMLFSTYTGSALTEKMRITAAGNVGIGTTSPVVKLQVDGTITSTGVLTAYTSVPSINIGHKGD